MSEILNIIGIDPGSRSLGVAVLVLNGDNVIHLSLETLHFDNLKYQYPECYREGSPADRILILTDTLRRRLKRLDANCLFIESPFINPGRISAFKPLVELNKTILEVVTEVYGRQFPVAFLAPVAVKKQMKTEKLDKDSMKKALLKNTQLANFTSVLEQADEHSLDAVAVALSGFMLNQ
jgi:Holliday junction resolvasome RuvABC endonuclease subunit